MGAPSGYTALDFVGFTDKGTYSTSATYMRNDLVHYGGNIMRCLIDSTTNVTPVVGANWELWVGASANLAERTIAPLENNPADVAYGVGRQIIYDDWLWEVIAPIAVGDALIDYAVDPTNANIKKSAPVETQLLAVKAEADATDNMIAPTETNASSSSAAYAVGDQLILNNILYTVTAPITIGNALVSGTGGNIEASDSLTDQLAGKVDSSDLGTAAAKDSTNAVTQNSTALVESGAVYTEVDSVKQALTTQFNELGAKNLCCNTNKTMVLSGVTFTKKSNGSVELSGVATSDIFYDIKPNTEDVLGLKAGESYILSGCPSDVPTGCSLYYNQTVSGTAHSSYDEGSGCTFTALSGITSDSVRIFIKSGSNFTTHKTFYPMIRPASITDNAFVPYTMTNKKLMSKIDSLDVHNYVNQTGSTSISLPSTWKEAYIRIAINNNYNELHTSAIHRDMFNFQESNSYGILFGVYFSANDYTSGRFFVTTQTDGSATISLNSAYVNGVNKLSNSSIAVYYR